MKERRRNAGTNTVLGGLSKIGTWTHCHLSPDFIPLESLNGGLQSLLQEIKRESIDQSPAYPVRGWSQSAAAQGSTAWIGGVHYHLGAGIRVIMC